MLVIDDDGSCYGGGNGLGMLHKVPAPSATRQSVKSEST